MGKVTCPYCFAGFRRQSIAFRCQAAVRGTATGAQCTTTVDERLAAYIGAPGPATLGPVFEADGSKSAATCPACGVSTFTRVCPECHNDLPADFADIGTNITAMIGPKTSGKSTYVTVLIRELQHRVGAAFGATTEPMDDRTIRLYKERFEGILYGQHMMLPGTLPSSVDRNYPLLYRFTIGTKGLMGTRSRSNALVFFDTAGEDLQDRTATENHVRYLAKSNGILLLIDPLQIEAVRELVGGTVSLPELETPPDQILDNVTRLIRSAKGVRGGRKVDTPVAIAFSKIDALWHRLPGDSRLHQPSRHDGAFDMADATELSEEIRALLSRWMGGSIVQHASFNYDHHKYFAVSALGAEPERSRVPAHGIAPFRVEDPVLWLLARAGIVPTKRPA